MKHFLLVFLLLFSPLFAISIDPSSRHFTEGEKKKRVDLYDFSGEFPNLENIDINARRKKCVELILTGEYPLLRNINYEGSFGVLTGEITGDFPNLTNVNLLCTSCAMDLDFRGNWQKSCAINLTGMKEDIALTLPKDITVIIQTKTGAKGKVIADGFKKKGWFRILKKKYIHQVEDSPIALTIYVETTEGNIILK